MASMKQVVCHSGVNVVSTTDSRRLAEAGLISEVAAADPFAWAACSEDKAATAATVTA